MEELSRFKSREPIRDLEQLKLTKEKWVQNCTHFSRLLSLSPSGSEWKYEVEITEQCHYESIPGVTILT